MGISLVYVDDELELCEIFAELFSNADTKVATYSNPEVAVQAIKRSPPDILFLDFRLPNTTGDEIASKLSLDIPIVLITGDLSLKPQYPFVKVLKKPYRPEEISAIVNAYNEGKKVG